MFAVPWTDNLFHNPTPNIETCFHKCITICKSSQSGLYFG